MKLHSALCSLIAAASFLISPVAQAEQNKIAFATEGAYAPFNFIDASGTPQGFDVDIARALCEKLKAECTIVAQDWDGIIPSLQAKRYDAIVASMSITKERQRVVSFTDPYYSNLQAFIGAKNAEMKTDKESLKGKTLGAQRSTISGQYLEDKLGDTVTVKLYDTQDNAYLDLVAGRLDGILSDKFPAYVWLKTEEGKNFEFKGDDIDTNDKIGIAVRKSDNELRERLNRALKQIIDDGTYKKINEKYFPFSIL